MAIKLADTARPNNHVDSEHLGTFPVAYAEDVWFEDGTRLSEKTFDGQNIQVTELPLVSATEEGHVYQYIGTTGTYTHGCFYECVETTTNNYVWKPINVIDSPVLSVDDDIYSHFNEYDEGAVIVYTGEDTPSYQKGHHYRKVVHGSASTYSVSVYQDSEHQTSIPYQSLEPVVEVGTILFYSDYNSGFIPRCKCIAISGDEYTLYRYEDGLITKSSYGVYIDTNSNSNLLTYWEDIGGGGGNEEFIGTQAEWNALSQSQKNKYDGKIVNITDDNDAMNECKILPYEFNRSSNISEFNRKWLVTGNSIVWTATHTGRLTIRCLKHGDGYSLYLTNQNSVTLDSYDNFFGDTEHGLTVSEASVTLQGWVRKGDVIELSTNLPASTDWTDKYFVQTGLLAYNSNFD